MNERELMFDGQALLDRLIAAKLAGAVDRPAVDLNVRYRFRDNEQAASEAFDVAEAFFSPLLSALYVDIATLRAEQDEIAENLTDLAHANVMRVGEWEVERRQLARLLGAKSDSTWRQLKEWAAYVTTAIVGDLVRERDQARAEDKRLNDLYVAAKAVVDAGRCAGLGSVGAALVAAVEAVTHPGGETP